MRANDWLTYIRSHCEDSGITLITNTDKVCADVENKVIYCPIPDESNEDQVALSVGFVKHEMAHILFSQPFQKLVSKTQLEDESFFKLSNAIEDARVEKELGRQFPGIARDFESLFTKLALPIYERIKKVPFAPQGMALLLREYLFNHKLSIPLDKVDEKLLELFNKNKVQINDKFIEATCSKDIINIALEIIKWFEEAKKKEEKEGKGKGKGKKGAKGEGDKKDEGKGKKDKEEKEKDKKEKDKDEEEKEEGGNKGEDEDGEEADSGGTESKSEPKGKSGKTKTEAVTGGRGAEEMEMEEFEKEVKDIDISESLKKLLKEEGISTLGRNEYRYAAKTRAISGDKLVSFLRDKTFGSSDKLQENPCVINSLRRVVLNFLTEKAKCRTLYNFKKGKMSTRHLHRVKVQGISPNVFSKKLEGEKVGADIMILVDWSGSMQDGVKIVRANEVMINMNKALEGIKGINFGIAGYSTLWGSGRCELRGSGCAVTEDTALYQLRTFGGKFNYEAMKYATRKGINKNNNDYESIKWAGQELSRQANKRKILLVIADGAPAVGGVCESKLEELTKAEIDHLRKQGVEVYGIGIQSYETEKLYGKGYFTEVDTAENLNTTIADELKKLLTK